MGTGVALAAREDSTSCCILCSGTIPLVSAQNKRKRTLTSLSQFVRARCRPTPHAYQYFSVVRGEQNVLLCVSCVNWQRRACSADRKKQAAPLLFMDHVALFMQQPGTIPFPDQRCVLRLLTALRAPENDWVPRLLLSLMPVPVQTMIYMMPSPPCPCERDVLTTIVRTWWDYNGRTVFYSHHLTAKLVRKMVRDWQRLGEAWDEEMLASLTQSFADS